MLRKDPGLRIQPGLLGRDDGVQVTDMAGQTLGGQLDAGFFVARFGLGLGDREVVAHEPDDAFAVDDAQGYGRQEDDYDDQDDGPGFHDCCRETVLGAFIGAWDLGLFVSWMMDWGGGERTKLLWPEGRPQVKAYINVDGGY